MTGQRKISLQEIAAIRARDRECYHPGGLQTREDIHALLQHIDELLEVIRLDARTAAGITTGEQRDKDS